MADLGPDWEAGETRGPIKETMPCKAHAAVTKGDLLYIKNITAANTETTVEPITGTSTVHPIGVALHSAAVNEYVQVLTRGFVKLTAEAGNAITQGEPVAQKDGEIVAKGTASSSGVFGRLMSSTAADADTIVLFIDTLGAG